MSKEAVCKRDECPYYGYFREPTDYPAVQRALVEAQAKAREDRNISKAGVNLIEALQLMQVIKTTCLACIHFEKQDMEASLMAGEALELLTKE